MNRSNKISALIKKMRTFDVLTFDAFALSSTNYELYREFLGGVDEPDLGLFFRGRPVFLNQAQTSTIFPGVAAVKWVKP